MSKKISELSELTPLNGEEFFAAIRNDLTWKVSLETLLSAPLSADRTIDLNGHGMSFENSEIEWLGIHPESKSAGIGSFDGFLYSSEINFSSNSEDHIESSWDAVWNDGEKQTRIEMFVDAGLATLNYTADTHTFNGAVILPDSDPGVAGALWNNAGTPAISTGE